MKRSSFPVRLYFLVVFVFLIVVVLFFAKGNDGEKLDTIYQFSPRDIDGNKIDLSKYRGKVINDIYFTISYTYLSIRFF